ncbi:MAG: alpha/beta hydrolase [Desulfocapsaceae bacterium]|nr:alpha/beta hydrolase [Desulfocapsaceae bacterium]
MNTLLFIPGAWMGQWVWEKLRKKLPPDIPTLSLTLSGLTRETTSPADIHLSTHISDVEQFIDEQKLENTILVGHSYSGYLAPIVASRRQDVVHHVIYIEAFLPVNGKSLLESTGLDSDHEIDLITNNQGKWPAPTLRELQEQHFLDEQQKEWLSRNFVGHPGQTVMEKAQLGVPIEEIPASFIGANKPDINWTYPNCKIEYHLLEAGHWPMIAAPEKLAKIIAAIFYKQNTL